MQGWAEDSRHSGRERSVVGQCHFVRLHGRGEMEPGLNGEVGQAERMRGHWQWKRELVWRSARRWDSACVS